MAPEECNMTKFDVVIRNGEIVTAAGSVGCADIGIADGVIVQIGGTLDGRPTRPSVISLCGREGNLQMGR
jgi:N-acyl-D-aspartate/D-glutamate deacylase